MDILNSISVDQDICRICLVSCNDLISMYQDEKEVCVLEGISIRQMITECSSHEIKQNDIFPKKICLKCIEDCKVAYNFRKQSESTYSTLTSLLDNSLVKIPENETLNKYMTLTVSTESSLPIKHECEILQTEKCTQTDEIAFYPCEKCESKFINYESLKEHRQEQHKGSLNKCRICSKVYNRMTHLKRHIAASHPEIGLSLNSECKFCHKRYTRPERLKKHMEQCHMEVTKEQKQVDVCVQFSCTECSGNFEFESDYKQHNCEKSPNSLDKPLYSVSLKESEILLDIKSRPNNLDKSSFPISLKEPELPLNTKLTNEEEFDNYVWETENQPEDDNHNNTSSDEDDLKPLAQLKAEANKKTQISSISSNKKPKSTKKQKSFSSKSKRENRCEECNKTFSRLSHLKRHLLTHSDEKPFKCDVCEKGFSRIDHLNLHRLHHADVKPFVCDICNRGFVRAEHLRKHKEARHSTRIPNPKTEFCEICKRFFSSAKYLQIHIKSHSERRWNCKHCEEIFKAKPDLAEHMKTHVNEKPFLCSECGLRFVRNDYLVIHMRRHKGEKPYKCKYCGKGFPRATDLTVHERYHTGEKTHLCTICGKGFQRAYNLLVHMRVHTGERPYQCPHCSKCFAQGNDLKAHIRRHTGERFKCDICGSGFIQGYHLTQHKRNAHGIDTQSHIRRVEKFTTPIEQQKQVEALQNRIKKTNADSASTDNNLASSVTFTTAVEAEGEESSAPLETISSLHDLVLSSNQNDVIEQSIKIENNQLQTLDAVQTQTLELRTDDNQLLQTTQYLVVEGSTLTPLAVNTPIYFTEIDSKLKYEHFE